MEENLYKTDSRFQKSYEEFGKLQTSSEKSKKLKFNGLHLSKNYIPSPKTLFTDLSNINFNWLVVWKMTWRMWQIFSRALKFGILMGCFNPNLKKYELKIHRGVICHDNEEFAKFESEMTCHFKVDMRNLTNFDPSTWKSQKFSL